MNCKIKTRVTIAALIALMWNSASPCPAKEPSLADGARVTFISAEGNKTTVRAEVADTTDSRRRGLMFRRHLASDRGMLFVFPHASRQKMWMKNTFVPLDLIFINEKLRIVGVVENARPHSTAVLEVPAPSRYVVEVNAFFCRRFGIREGDRVVIERIQITP
ncbi:MAG: DUF192 domain-containing protein [Deltaproteobacteria bacterium]|nr:DUF192 domain-containing protein [Deltaproteobacteria bacterium]